MRNDVVARERERERTQKNGRKHARNMGTGWVSCAKTVICVEKTKFKIFYWI